MQKAYYLKGYTLIFAIVVMIIITSFALLFLSYFQVNYMLLNQVKSRAIARSYCYQGFTTLGSSTLYDLEQSVDFSDGLSSKLLKKKWGVFDLCYSTVLKNQSDTLFNKIALSGFQKVQGNDLALYLRKSNSMLSTGDSVRITGKCFVPAGSAGSISGNGTTPFQAQQLLPSLDTIMRLPEIDSILAWAKSYNHQSIGKLLLDDSLDASFNKATNVLTGDSVIISKYLKGNIIVCGKHIRVLEGVPIHDVILIGNTISFPDNFKGSAQIFANGIVTIGRSATFDYPSVLALFPEMTSDKLNVGDRYFIAAGDSLNFSGEVYDYAFNYNVSLKSSIHFASNSTITGGIYSTGTVSFEGNCKGYMICEKLLNTDQKVWKANFIRNTIIDSVPAIFSYSNIAPFKGQQKIVKWMQ